MSGNTAARTGSLIWLARAGWWLAIVVCVTLTAVGLPYFYADSLRACEAPPADCPMEQFSTADVAAFEAIGVPLPSFIAFYSGFYLLFIAVWWGIAAAIFLRRSDDSVALLTATFLVMFPGATFSPFVDQAVASAPWYAAMTGLALLIGELSTMGFFLLFPGGRFAPPWLRWVALALVPVFAADYLLPGTPFDRDEWPVLASIGFFAVYVVLQLGAQIYRYRYVSTPEQRQQSRWVVFGGLVGLSLFFGVLLVVIASGHPFTSPVGQFGFLIAQSAMLAIPVSLGIAILRYRLWDIDVIIRRTLAYTVVTVALGTIYFGGVVALQALFVRLTGQESALAVVASTLAIAALFGPLRRRVQRLVDRRFDRTRYDARRVLAQFAARAQREADLDTLSADLLATVDEALKPTEVRLWLVRSG